MLNLSQIQGRLVYDPELKKTTNGKSVLSFTVACERSYKTGDEYLTDFIDCVAYGTLAERISRYWVKGKPILVVGSIQTRNWEDRNGNKRKSTEIKADNAFFELSTKTSELYYGENREAPAISEPEESEGKYQEIPDEDDLPF